MDGIILFVLFTGTASYSYYKFTHRKPKVEYAGHEDVSPDLRNTVEYRNFRIEVLKRDDFQCIWCKATNNLEVHHWYSYSSFPDGRLDPKNAATLCSDCHKLTPNYGSKERAFSQQLKSQ
jgi:hypothetical protein